jgi:parallel beta-helix repeat protein
LNVGPQPWDSTWVFYPEVLFDGAIYRMWYTGYNENTSGIGYATSVDRTTWTKLNNPVLSGGPPGSWDESVWDVSVTYDGTTYHMWYMGWDGNISRIGYATSLDGINWTKYDDPSTVNPPFAESDPVMNPGDPGMWDAAAVLSPCIINTGTTYQMWYAGGDSLNPGTPFPVGGKIGYATSFDGITWIKADRVNPVLEGAGPGGPTSWWEGGVGDPDVLFDSTTYHMYYDGGGWDGTFRFRIGYATAPVTIHVPYDVPTIQAGINSASDGNIVLVADGTYLENINFKGKAITVASHFLMDGDSTHIDSTIIDGSQPSHPDSGSVVSFVSGEDTTSILYGFTITGGTGTILYDPYWNLTYMGGGGVFCGYSGARISHNKIEGNNIVTNLNGAGGGVGVGPIANPFDVILEGNKIQFNTVQANGSVSGGGVTIVSQARILNNIIHGNSCSSVSNISYGGGFMCASVPTNRRSIILHGNTITENTGSTSSSIYNSLGGGIEIWHSIVDIRNNIISNNQLGSPNENYGAGIRIWDSGEGNILENNIISDNTWSTGTCYGGGIRLFTASPIIQNNIISDNSATNGGGFYVSDTSNPQIINNTITGNAAIHGGGIYSTNSYPIVMNTILWDDSAVVGEEIRVSGGSVNVVYTNVDSLKIFGNWSGIGNINADPLFSDTLYHLSDTSLCIGAAIDAYNFGSFWCYCPPYDIYSNPRPDPAGSNPDIGACESPHAVPTGLKQSEELVLATYHLDQNFPNPFNPSTTIEFDLPKTSEVTLKIFNILGEEVTTLVSDRLSAGSYSYEWDASNLASGVYLYRLEAEGYVETKKMILMK